VVFIEDITEVRIGANQNRLTRSTQSARGERLVYVV
jgi:hypothetical protein